ncbi:PLP-dependent aminotransferase family protein [Thaumasiovibrio subtropicus]|uniref:aminotransferase-like domain-containing protein n=1 Tax=Thaumasiovibrio subtropicus TaxID=1891207 RepID=UPI000B35638C|nr:PLP-dependent aminotransferase family protein [Thaumasiovibrio subtropicus]
MLNAAKYHQVKDYIEAAIQTGRLVADEKLPSIRALSQSLAVSKNTVIRAYQELEASDIIYALPRSGYRVKSQQPTLPPIPISPADVDLHAFSHHILKHDPTEFTMPAGSAHPNIDTPAIKSLYAEIGRQSRHQSYSPSHYQLPPGDDDLRKGLAKVNEELGVLAPASAITVTYGAQQAVSLVLRVLTKPGDIVLVESPCYFGILLLMESLQLQVVEVPSHPATGIDLDAMQQALDAWPVSLMVLTPNFSNPTGSQIPLAHRQQILAMSGHIPIIEDDVFGALHFDATLPPLYALDTEDRVIYCNSMSKTLDSRLRLGWIIAGKHQQALEKMMMGDHMGSINLVQTAVASFLKTGKYRQQLHRVRRLYQQNQKCFHQHLCEALDAHENVKGRYQLTRPKGGFISWLILPEGVDGNAIYDQCVNEKIGVLPGSLFGTAGQFNHCVRFNSACYRDTPQWQTGISTFARIVSHTVSQQC